MNITGDKAIAVIVTCAVVIAVVIFWGYQSNLSRQGKVRAYLEDQGYTHVDPTGQEPWNCKPHEDIAEGFDATTRLTKKRVHGVVCCSSSLSYCAVSHNAHRITRRPRSRQ